MSENQRRRKVQNIGEGEGRGWGKGASGLQGGGVNFWLAGILTRRSPPLTKF